MLSGDHRLLCSPSRTEVPQDPQERGSIREDSVGKWDFPFHLAVTCPLPCSTSGDYEGSLEFRSHSVNLSPDLHWSGFISRPSELSGLPQLLGGNQSTLSLQCQQKLSGAITR